MRHTADGGGDITMEDDVLAISKPWAVQNERNEVALTFKGETAMRNLLFLHDLIDCEQLARGTCSPYEIYTEQVNAADRFIEEHGDHSCVPGIEADGLVVLMVAFKFRQEQFAKETAS